MVSLEDAVIARYETGGNRFEILIDPKSAQEYKEGDDIDWEDAIAADGIWADSAKGDRAPEHLVNDAFGTTELIEIYKKILDEGTIQLTAQQRNEMVDQKKKQIVAHIVANAMNPQTGGPHPPQRIENAIERIQSIIKDVEVGDVYQGKVVKLMDFGAFVNFMGSKDGLVHISQLKKERFLIIINSYLHPIILNFILLVY